MSLLNMAIIEGSADYITKTLLGLNINSKIHDYGELHQTELWKEFSMAVKSNPYNYGDWLYNGSPSNGRPADLGYFLGSKITEGYFNNLGNNKKAIKTILKRGKYKKVFAKSGITLNS